MMQIVGQILKVDSFPNLMHLWSNYPEDNKSNKQINGDA